MALGRLVNKDTQHKVIVHTLGKHRYASTKVFIIGEDDKKRYSYKHWGGHLMRVTDSILEETTSMLRQANVINSYSLQIGT